MPIASIQLRGVQAGRPYSNSLWFEHATGEMSNFEMVADEISDLWDETLASLLSNQLTMNDVAIRIYDGGLPWSNVYVPTSFPLTGGASGEALPAQNNVLLGFAAADGRPNRGRNYVGVWPETAWQTGTWGSTILAAVLAYGEALQELAGADHWIARPDDESNSIAAGHKVSTYYVRAKAGAQLRRRGPLG